MKIMYLNGALTGQTMELIPSGTMIGRESDNTIQLPMGGVSRYHAKIERDAAGNWLIRDLGSTNGTLVDDIPVEGVARLASGSVITIGDQLLRCMDSAPAPAGNPPSVQPGPAVQPSSVSPQPTVQQSTQVQQPFFFRPQNTTSNVPTSTGPVPEMPKPAPAPSAPSPASAPVSPAEVPHGLFKKKQNAAQQANHTKKLLSNVIFALIVILAACVGLWIFLKLNETSQTPVNQPPAKKKVENPFVLYYEKESVSGTAVFRFVLQVENGLMEVTLDEPQNKRRYYELFKEPLPDTLIEKLKQQILDSGFMDLQQEKIAGTSQDNRQHRRIMVGFGSKFCDVKVSNDVSETFNRVETIINETLLDEYDLGVISQNVDRILEDARTFLFVAEEAFRNIDTTPSNLPKAIVNYRLALRRYQLFDDPKPAEWKTARDGLAKAEAKLEEIHQEGLKNVRLFYEQREYDKAIAECNRLLDIFPPDSKTYQAIRENKIKIEKKMSLRNN
jgi:hypothetical protein